MTLAYKEEKEITCYVWNKPQNSFSVIVVIVVIIVIIILIVYLHCADSILLSVPYFLSILMVS